MEIKNKLLQKLGIMTNNLAIEFISLEVDDKIPTVAMLAEKYSTARGTVQSALKLLQDYDAIKLESRGHLGTRITDIDHIKLLQLADINSLVGVMPLPYSKRYEGLATGVFNTLNNEGISANLAFMRGANHRLKALKDGRYDFAITSRLSAEYYVKNDEPIDIVLGFGDYSYVNEHVLVLRDGFDGVFEKGSKVGIDKSSIDQTALTTAYFKDLDVQYIDLSYSQLTKALTSGEIDAAIWNRDDIEDNNSKIKFINIEKSRVGISDTEAVIIINKENELVKNIFHKKLSKESVLDYQKKVLNELIMPNY